jgi:hypothetical protein
MTRAVLKNGMICPIDALPPEWHEGQTLRIEAMIDEDDSSDIDTWLRELDEMVAENDPADLARVEESIRLADEQAKAIVRKQMGLP